jgi:RNA polymerase sigma-70 factor (ECF subfamily)
VTAGERSTPDGEWRDRLVAGEEAALAELYDRFAPLVHGLALRVTGDRAGAQDVTQEVFVQVWEHPSRFDPERGGLRAWLGVIAHRRAVDWVRREVAHQRTAASAADQADPDRAPPLPGPAETVLAADTRAQVRLAVEALPEPQRACVRLAYFEGYTYRQVAAVLGIPEGTAKSRVRLGLAALARRLGQAGLTEASDAEDRT